MSEVVIVAAARTAVGKFGGTIAKVSAAELGAHVIKGLVSRTGIDPSLISEVLMDIKNVDAAHAVRERVHELTARFPLPYP